MVIFYKNNIIIILINYYYYYHLNEYLLIYLCLGDDSVLAVGEEQGPLVVFEN